MDTRKVKAIQEKKWPLTQKRLRSLVGLANYYHQFILDFLKAIFCGGLWSECAPTY